MKRVFISYAHEDAAFRDALAVHLQVLCMAGIIEQWHDGQLGPGEDWKATIDREVHAADIVVLLVSASFLASRSCQELELAPALARWAKRDVVVVPVVVRACDWDASPLAKLQILPTRGKPVATWPHPDDAWTEVTRAIRVVASRGAAAAAVATSWRAAHLPEVQSVPPESSTARAPDSGQPDAIDADETGAPAPSDVVGAPGDRPRASPGRRVDRERFLAECTPAARTLFVFFLDEAIRRGHHVYWGTSGFSVGAYFPGPSDRWSFAYGYPADDFQFYFQEGAPWSRPEEASAFRRDLLLTGIFREAGRLTLKSRVDDGTSALAHEAARNMFARVDESIRGARTRLNANGS